MTRYRFILLILGLIGLFCLGGCSRAPAEATEGLVIIPLASPTATSTAPPEPTPTPTALAAYPAPGQLSPPLSGAYPAAATPYPAAATLSLPEITSTTTQPAPQATATPPGAYPLPGDIPAYLGGYPAPEFGTYPFPVVATNSVPTIPPPTPGPSATPGGSLTPTVSLDELPPAQPAATPPSVSLVRIWHAWSYEQTQALAVVVAAFQEAYPEIQFDVTSMPQVDLRSSYEAAAYNGGGPGLLIAPAEWGPQYFESQLVSDLTVYASTAFLGQINPAALGTGRYAGALLSLPIAQRGVVLYRNAALIPQAAETFDELTAHALAATRGGNLGAYFDRGAFYSAANLNGLGGALMDADQMPAFNTSAGLAWLDLMADYDTAGAVGMNTNRDLDLFMDGRIGYIIEGTWQMDALTEALGDENLVIDPWPSYGSGHLSGFVQTEAVFLNPNVTGRDQYAALLFMGFLLTPDVQQYLAEFGMIPAVRDTDPRPVLVAQAARAFETGTAYPPVADIRLLNAYWEGLQLSLDQVFIQNIAPLDALQAAEDLVLDRIDELNP